MNGWVPECSCLLYTSWFSQSAEVGNQYAQYMLGKLYLMGNGVEQDEDTAFGWFHSAAEQGHAYAQFFLNHQETLRSPSVMLSVTRLLHHMGNIFQETAPTAPTPVGMHIDRKRLQQLREKKIALGHRPDDHEEQQTGGGMTMKGW